ncbi:MAG: hypothetical protein KatS3mg060_1968 [Dehalococcoidia bacterium]|nr:MAG: hypothetical protein KatS3mg060_1968 [Dehalococcoidia bacterium]
MGVGASLLIPRLMPQTATPTMQSATVQRGAIAQTVMMSGSTAPGGQANLSFGTNGRLAEVFVKVGDEVTAGQPLAKLDTGDLELALRQARASLASAQANAAETSAGPKASELASAASAVTSAEANLVKARSDLEALTRPKSADEVASAAAALEKARAALQDAQTAYDRVAWRNDASATSQAVTLQTATADYQAALAAYNLAIAPPKPNEVAAAEAAVRTATDALESAKVKLAEVQAGPTSGTIASARASVEQAAVAVATAERNLQNATLLAPFAGRIAAVNFRPGGNGLRSAAYPRRYSLDALRGRRR